MQLHIVCFCIEEQARRLTILYSSLLQNYRTHQLNVHCAAFGHPIVADAVYGLDGDAASNGGLSEEECNELAPNPNRVDEEMQKQIAAAASGKSMCVHAKSISFRHPITKKDVTVTSAAPF